MTALRPLSAAEFEAWLPQAIEAYARDKTAAGQWTPDEALARSREDHARLLPQGLATADHHLCAIVNSTGTAVGVLWFARQRLHGLDIAYVYHLEVDPPHRRQGHATGALRGLEQACASFGFHGMALHVFGHNGGARQLYARLGFEPTNISLFKRVGAGD
ncbi:GNAT family N-acetyltransferase [Ideonella sp. 4Y11]|uniref:GNAT family N-acetyltransferase n=1 Tax=Ideonella aquatica TaxID=2824119 RepID=A0A940YK15_9BURK|nr:GNAT family N-acetyltransferase [Ideonella aquatica]MBQ0961683.1 GNAT family N-acetyltransferase [Ideonella aquatica]